VKHEEGPVKIDVSVTQKEDYDEGFEIIKAERRVKDKRTSQRKFLVNYCKSLESNR
jgi:hypothetical protein